MSGKKTMMIAAPRGLTIPGHVLGKEKDVAVSPHETIRVPADYGQHLIDDRFAVEVPAKGVKTDDGATAGKDADPSAKTDKGAAA